MEGSSWVRLWLCCHLTMDVQALQWDCFVVLFNAWPSAVCGLLPVSKHGVYACHHSKWACSKGL